ncbi:hypothetical protein B0T25DRAFT_30208 [Lasiosphaeria hispida]|uniref:Uncharacterized protein n=1 Tax=Lasiosphaeria hispida TaxID=260671 RepID=A0AAJ0HUR4_9PEZI|nr:hypothetical protein B0T25DRAFT_30208 [Lasiosphaeria hispida]
MSFVSLLLSLAQPINHLIAHSTLEPFERGGAKTDTDHRLAQKNSIKSTAALNRKNHEFAVQLGLCKDYHKQQSRNLIRGAYQLYPRRPSKKATRKEGPATRQRCLPAPFRVSQAFSFRLTSPAILGQSRRTCPCKRRSSALQQKDRLPLASNLGQRKSASVHFKPSQTALARHFPASQRPSAKAPQRHPKRPCHGTANQLAGSRHQEQRNSSCLETYHHRQL